MSVSSRPASAPLLRTFPSLSQQFSFPHLALLLNKANVISVTNTFNAFKITTTAAFVEGELASRLRRPQACRLLPPPFPCRGCCVNLGWLLRHCRISVRTTQEPHVQRKTCRILSCSNLNLVGASSLLLPFTSIPVLAGWSVGRNSRKAYPWQWLTTV